VAQPLLALREEFNQSCILVDVSVAFEFVAGGLDAASKRISPPPHPYARWSFSTRSILQVDSFEFESRI
jgi:hypothetical protein